MWTDGSRRGGSAEYKVEDGELENLEIMERAAVVNHVAGCLLRLLVTAFVRSSASRSDSAAMSLSLSVSL